MIAFGDHSPSAALTGTRVLHLGDDGRDDLGLGRPERPFRRFLHVDQVGPAGERGFHLVRRPHAHQQTGFVRS